MTRQTQIPTSRMSQRQVTYPKQVARSVADAKVGLVTQLDQGAKRRLKL